MEGSPKVLIKAHFPTYLLLLYTANINTWYIVAFADGVHHQVVHYKIMIYCCYY